MIFKKIINHIGLLRQEVQNYSRYETENKLHAGITGTYFARTGHCACGGNLYPVDCNCVCIHNKEVIIGRKEKIRVLNFELIVHRYLINGFESLFSLVPCVSGEYVNFYWAVLSFKLYPAIGRESKSNLVGGLTGTERNSGLPGLFNHAASLELLATSTWADLIPLITRTHVTKTPAEQWKTDE